MSEDLIKDKLNNHEKRIENLENVTSTLQTMNYRIERVENTTSNMNDKLDIALAKEASEKSKKWDKLVDYIFYFILACLLGYIAYSLGIQK